MSCDADDRPLQACLDLSGDTWKCEPADIQKARKTRSRRVATARDRARGPQEPDHGSQAKDCQPDSKSHREVISRFLSRETSLTILVDWKVVAPLP